MEREFGLKYQFQLGRWKREELNQNEGAADRVVLLAVMHLEDGSQSQAIWSCDGMSGGGLSGMDLFKAWWLMGANLAMDDTTQLPEELRNYLLAVSKQNEHQMVLSQPIGQVPTGETVH